MKLITLPTELLIEIVQYLPNVADKCQVLQTCSQLKHLFCTQSACWSQLDFSPYSTVSNGDLLNFLKDKQIRLYSNTPLISKLDLSGCWCLSQDMVVGLSKSFSGLNELYLNGYRLQSKRYHERDHLYQMRPSHDLASMTMDLSKKSIYQLKVPFVLLVNIFQELKKAIKVLSIQYQDLTSIQYNHFQIFDQVQHLDISSCTLSQAGLQLLIRKSGKQLISLKMLNIELNSLSWLCLTQFCKALECLHVSCTEPTYLGCIRQCVASLKQLQDFRLTRMRTGNLDGIIERLNPNKLKRLDLSPKMNVYLNGARMNSPTIKTMEHDLLLTGLQHLVGCHQLIELRLCFPVIPSSSFGSLFKALPQLEIFELRKRQDAEDKNDSLTGLKYLENLKEIYLYSVPLTNQSIETLSRLPLHHITVVNQPPIDPCLFYKSNQLQTIHVGQNSSFIKRNHDWYKI